ncbi:MAG: polysaccharide biosynthesis tyrosine autokinase [Prevotellaceae bacterium]|jgi:capsular exopolysaccharide synthesis family protein|nr:polysaccharide biosynthesis tyrosine autokinase [Prevotellaceae bacterium]
MALSTDELYRDLSPVEESADFKKTFFKYLAYWKWFVCSFGVFVLLGGVYLFLATPQYRVQASILIKDDKKMGSGAGAGISMLEELDLFSSKKVVENEIEILRSYTLMEEVVKDLNLQVAYTVRDGLRKKELYENSPVKIEVISPAELLYEEPLLLQFENDRIRINDQLYPKNALITESFGSIRTTVNDSLLPLWKEKTIEVTIAPREAVIEDLREDLTVETSAKGTSVINLSLLSPVPQRGQDILNHLITVYNKAAIVDKNNLAKLTLAFIDGRLELLSIDLQDAEQKVEEYKSAQGITDISTEAELFLKAVQQNDIELNQVNIQLDVLQHIESYVLSNENKGGTTPATLGLSDPTLLELIGLLVEAESERAKALHTMKPANPMVQALNDQINALKRNIIGNIQTLRRSLEITQRNLKTENRRLEIMIQSVPKKERELVDLTRQKEIKNQLYIYLLSKREETAISYASTVSDSRLVDAARSTLRPVSPKKSVVLLVFGLIGLLFPAVVMWVLDWFDNKISSKDEIEKNIKSPVIGEISFVEQATKILSMTQSRSKHAEQIRTLRTNLEFMQAGGGIKVVLITSSVSGEGKSFLSANLGAALAALDKKVIVLGFDLRKPGLHKIFGMDNEEGLSNYLVGQAGLSQVIRKSEIDNMDIITCGHIPPNPQELLQGAALPRLFEELKAQYDYIIVDTPPVSLVSDAVILDRHADVTVYIIRQNYTPKDRIKSINDLYETKKLKNFGIVVNGIREEKWHGYYHYYSYGSYKYYGKYYGEEEAGKKSRRHKHKHHKNKS